MWLLWSLKQERLQSRAAYTPNELYHSAVGGEVASVDSIKTAPTPSNTQGMLLKTVHQLFQLLLILPILNATSEWPSITSSLTRGLQFLGQSWTILWLILHYHKNMCDKRDLKLITTEYIMKNETKKAESLHFLLDDDMFTTSWNNVSHWLKLWRWLQITPKLSSDVTSECQKYHNFLGMPPGPIMRCAVCICIASTCIQANWPHMALTHEQTVPGTLKAKHPPPQQVNQRVLLANTDQPHKTDPNLIDSITGSTIWSAILKCIGSANPSRLDAAVWRCICNSFKTGQSTSHSLLSIGHNQAHKGLWSQCTGRGDLVCWWHNWKWPSYSALGGICPLCLNPIVATIPIASRHG